MDAVHHTLEEIRLELLDLGLRNPLLNHRTFRARGVDLVDEQPVTLCQGLVEDGRSYTFLPPICHGRHQPTCHPPHKHC